MLRESGTSLSVMRAIFRGVGSDFYLGDTIVQDNLRYYRSEFQDDNLKKIYGIYEGGTQKLLEYSNSDIFFGTSVYETLLQRFSNVFEHFPKIPSRTIGSEKKKNIEFSYTIVTPFHTHFEFFKRCAASVNRLTTYATVRGMAKFEWIIVNDDPRFSGEDLLSVIPDSLRPFTKIINNTSNSGIVYSLNKGVEAASCDWILLLDCDDMLRYDALAVLDYYANLFPDVSYITSTMIDIFEDGSFIRPRLRRFSQSMTADKGMIFGHLKAYKRNNMNVCYGWHDHASEGCQDYELALRIAKNEAILMIPEPLYYYRWHQKSQSIGRALKQSSTSTQVIYNFISRNLAQGVEQHETNIRDYSNINVTLYVICHVDDLSGLANTVNSALAINCMTRIMIIFIGPVKFQPEFLNSKIQDILNLTEMVEVDFFYCYHNFVNDAADRIQQLIKEEKMANSFDEQRRSLLILSSGDELSPLFVEKYNAFHSDQLNYDAILLKTDQGNFRPLLESNEYEYCGCEFSSDAFIVEDGHPIIFKIISKVIDSIVSEVKVVNPLSAELSEFSSTV